MLPYLIIAFVVCIFVIPVITFCIPAKKTIKGDVYYVDGKSLINSEVIGSENLKNKGWWEKDPDFNFLAGPYKRHFTDEQIKQQLSELEFEQNIIIGNEQCYACEAVIQPGRGLCIRCEEVMQSYDDNTEYWIDVEMRQRIREGEFGDWDNVRQISVWDGPVKNWYDCTDCGSNICRVPGTLCMKCADEQPF